MPKYKARTNGNEYQTDSPHIGYPLYCTEEQAREWISNGILELIEEPKAPEPPTRRYKRRDMEAENGVPVENETSNGDEPAADAPSPT